MCGGVNTGVQPVPYPKQAASVPPAGGPVNGGPADGVPYDAADEMVYQGDPAPSDVAPLGGPSAQEAAGSCPCCVPTDPAAQQQAQTPAPVVQPAVVAQPLPSSTPTAAIDPTTGQAIDPTTGQPVATTPVAAAPVPAPLPAPISAPGTVQAPAPIGPATGVASAPANTLSTWPQWEQAFQGLGAGPEQIAMIGSSPLTEDKLALTYVSIAQQLQELGQSGTPEQGPEGTTPGQQPGQQPVDPTTPTNPTDPGQQLPGKSAWSEEIAQAFAALGLNAEQLELLRQKAEAEGADMPTLSRWYEEIASLQQGQSPAGADGQMAPQGEPAQWTPEIEAQLTELGAPASVIEMYKASALGDPAKGVAGTTAEGLQQAIASLAERKAKFDETGKADELKKLGMTEDQIWQSFILPVEPQTKDQIQEQITSLKWAGFNPLGAAAAVPGVGPIAAQAGKYAGQGLIQALPFAGLVQAARGKSFFTDQPISLTDPGDLGMLAISAAGTYAAIRGMRHIGQAMKAINSVGGGMTASRTVAGLAGEAGAAQVQLGALGGGGVNWMKMLNPFNGQYRQEIVSLGMIENGAKHLLDNEQAYRALGAQGDAMIGSFQGMTRDVLTGKVNAATTKGVFGTPWSFLSGILPRSGKAAAPAGRYLPAGVADVKIGSSGGMSAMIGTTGKTKVVTPVAAATDGVLGTMTLSHTLRPGNGAAAFQAVLSAAGERLGHDAVALRGMLGADGKFASATEPLEQLSWLRSAARTPEDLLRAARSLAHQSDTSIATFATDLPGLAASQISPGAIPGIRRGAHNYLQDAATAVERQGTFDPVSGARTSYGTALLDDVLPQLAGTATGGPRSVVGPTGSGTPRSPFSPGAISEVPVTIRTRNPVTAPPATPRTPSAEQTQALAEAEQVLISKGYSALVDAGRTMYSDPVERASMYQKIVADGTLFPDGFPG